MCERIGSALRDPNRFLILDRNGLDGDKFCSVLDTLCSDDNFVVPVSGSDQILPAEEDARVYWVGNLITVLANLHGDIGKKFRDILTSFLGKGDASLFLKDGNPGKPYPWIGFIQTSPELWSNALDEFDGYLLSMNRHIFIAYNNLDYLPFPFIQSLIHFWFTQLMRWGGLHCKIFLRSDSIEPNCLNFVDASKLCYNKLILS